MISGSAKRKKLYPTKHQFSGFVDRSYWKLEKVCSGLIFKGHFGEVTIDPRYFQPCSCWGKDYSRISTPVPTSLTSPGTSNGGSNYDEHFSLEKPQIKEDCGNVYQYSDDSMNDT